MMVTTSARTHRGWDMGSTLVTSTSMCGLHHSIFSMGSTMPLFQMAHSQSCTVCLTYLARSCKRCLGRLANRSVQAASCYSAAVGHSSACIALPPALPHACTWSSYGMAEHWQSSAVAEYGHYDSCGCSSDLLLHRVC